MVGILSPRRMLLAVITVLVLAIAGVTVALQAAHSDVTTGSIDTDRTSWDSNEPGLGPADVESSDFGQQFSTAVDGNVYGQPLVVGSTVIVATENNEVYGLDSTTGAIEWSKYLGAPWPAATIACGDLTPNIGVTSAPVYDPSSGLVYLTAKVNDGATAATPSYKMFALDPTSGAIATGWPVTIGGSPSNDTSITFNPELQLQRPALLLMGGVVYAAFGSHCDHGSYRGYVVGVTATSGSPKQTAMWTDEAGSSSSGSGIWQAGGGLVSDGPGRILFSTGNGVMAAASAGTKVPSTLSESVVQLSVNSNGSLSASDFFSPANSPTLDTNDTDLGSGGPVALPAAFGTSAHPNVLIEQGKDGRVFLLDRDALGGREQGPGNTDAVLDELGPYQGEWGHPAAWSSDNGNYVYLVDNGGPMRALEGGSNGSQPTLSPAGTSTSTFPYTSGSPLITSNGNDSGSGVVWEVWSSGSTGTEAELRAYSAIPDSSGTLKLLYAAPIGTAVKFAEPTSNDNHIYVGTRDGHVLCFGKPATSLLTGSPVSFSSTAVGSTASATLTLTATSAVTVTGVTTNAPFAVNAPALPKTLGTGDTLSIPVTFTPGSPGAASDVISVATDHGTLGFAVSGSATESGLFPDPAAATFSQVPVGSSQTLNVNITNYGNGTSETVGSVTPPSGPFTTTGLPSAGTVIPAGSTFVASITYDPTAATTDTSSITITSTSGTMTLPINGTAVAGQAKLVMTPSGVNFGSVAVGQSRTMSFDIANVGNIPATITKAKAPAGDFSSGAPLNEGTVIGAGEVINQTVTFTPSAPGSESASYVITGDTGQGAFTVPLTGTGTGPLPAIAEPAWSVNGSAAMVGATLRLTERVKDQAGSAFYGEAVPTNGLHATFTAQLGPGGGGDGLTFAMIMTNNGQGPTSVGKDGGNLGFVGLNGLAVALRTTGGNYVGLLVGKTGAYAAKATVPTSLRSGTHAVSVTVSGGVVTVSVGGKQLIRKAVPATELPSTAYVGFTGGTGSEADYHAVTGATVTTVAPPGAPLTPAPPAEDFGEIQVNASTSATITLTDKSSQPDTITAVGAPAAPFAATLPAVGSTVQPGASITVPVSFSPTSDGSFTGTFSVATTGGKVVVALTGSGDADLPDFTYSSWTYSGSTTVAGKDATLTTAGQKDVAGAIFNSIPVPALGLKATFTAYLGGAKTNGADGMTFALLNASTAKATGLGLDGSGLGVAGLPAVFVALDTWSNTGVTSHNFMAVGTSTAGAKQLTFLKTTTAIPALRTGTHTIGVTVTTASYVVVTIDGKQVLNVKVTLPSKVLAGFTGAVGGDTDTHEVINPTISYL